MKKKEIIILLLVIAALSYHLIVQRKSEVHYSLPILTKIEADDLTKIVIKRQSSEVTIEKADGEWLITPEKSKADKALVDRMLKEISELTLSALVSESKNYSIYELDDEKSILVTAFANGDNPVRTIKVGKPASPAQHTFVTVGDDYRVYHAIGNIKSVFDKTASTLRDKTIFSFDGSEITGLLLDKEGKKIVIKAAAAEADVKEEENKDKEVKPKWVTEKGEPVKEKEVNEIIDTLKNLQCDGYAEGVKKEDLKDPIFKASVKGNKEYTLSIYEKEDSSKYKAASVENAFAFLLSEYKVKKIMKDIDTLREKKE